MPEKRQEEKKKYFKSRTDDDFISEIMRSDI